MSNEDIYQDVSELLQTGEPVILAVDQVPFEVESRGVKNTFCLLVPLMTESGLELNREEFHNRERVWWMLRPDIEPHQIQVGTVWSGPIERSRAYGNPGKEKDHYQVRRADIRSGVKRFFEVLNINVAHPDLSELLSPEGIAWPYPPLPRAIVRGGLSVLGPFATNYDYENRRVRLSSLNEEDPHVYRLEQAEFEQKIAVREFAYQSNQWDAKAQEKEVGLSFIDESVIEHFFGGEKFDGATDTEVVTWALDFMETESNERELFNKTLDTANKLAPRVDNPEFKERMDRFTKLCENRQRIVELGSGVATAVAERDGFKSLVDQHIETITKERIDSAIESRSQEIEEVTRTAEEKLAELEERSANLQREYEERKQAWEDEFQKEYGERASLLDTREATVSDQEREMRSRLEGLIETYRNESDSVTQSLLAQLPIMRSLGLLTAGRAETNNRSVAPEPAADNIAPPHELQLPEYLTVPRACDPGMEYDEQKFVSQFQSVVEGQGFVFDEEDLINFHVLAKTGLWTVLAGASGLGKSSLPRLYAESLGCLDEYLLVSVRPDWLDDRDVIGAFNALSERYEPAACGIVDRLITAYEDYRRKRGGIYVICMDEMNLARVEHYFAQFLSLLEQPQSERQLSLFSRGMATPNDPYSLYRKLPFCPNVRIVGTVNIDETTHFFSPKVIDRVSIAHFERPDLRQGLQDDYMDEPPNIEPVHLDQYNRWVKAPDRDGAVIELILKTEESLRRSRCGLGFRVRDRILRYVSSARPLLGEDRAIDMAFLQNVLPSLRPIAPRYMELLKDLIGLFPENRFRRTGQLLRALEEDPESDFFQLL